MCVHRERSLRLAVIIGMALGMTSWLTDPQAATFNIPAEDVGALIAAINTANENGEDDTINLAAGTYTLTEVDNYVDNPSGLPSIVSTITIRGSGDDSTIINRDEDAPQFRIFHISGHGYLILEGLVVSGGLGRGGGAIANSEGRVVLLRTTITKNMSEGDAGGILNAGYLLIQDSTISHNFAGLMGDGDGGGISTILGFSGNPPNASSLTVVNTTISNNYAFSNAGGLHLDQGEVQIINSTITKNTAGLRGLGDGGGLRDQYAANTRVSNTIIAGNIIPSDSEGPDCIVEIRPDDEDNPTQTLTSLGHNLIGSHAGCPNDGPGDIVVNAAEVFSQVLGPLQDNGGPTETHALLAGSPAIDAGEAVCADADDNPLTTDQRGALRPVDGDSDGVAACDIGAFELQMEKPPEPASPCKIATAAGEVTGFAANGQEVKLPKDLHRRIDRVATQPEYQLSLYTWFGSTRPFAEAQGSLDLDPDTQVKKVKCEAISAPEPPPDPASPCEIVTAAGEVTGFAANGQEVKLPKDLHRRIDWATTQPEYQLSLYTWFGSTRPFAEAQGSLDLDPNTQVKKVKCEAR